MHLITVKYTKYSAGDETVISKTAVKQVEMKYEHLLEQDGVL